MDVMKNLEIWWELNTPFLSFSAFSVCCFYHAGSALTVCLFYSLRPGNSSFSHADQETSKKTNIPLVLVQTNQLNIVLLHTTVLYTSIF